MTVHDSGYPEKVYAGVLGKIIGVYVGRPFEQRDHAWIEENLGEITGYVHERLGQPLIVTDDDISGTFGFLRAYDDYGPAVTAAQTGETWLNQIIEGKTILWWGGIGSSTEHTAYLRLAGGMNAPQSGSIATNGQIVAEQIGAQIFIDGWGLLNPGDPERAADLARRAASVSHDGVAIHGAQMVAAMVASAFVEDDIQVLIESGLQQIPQDSTLRKVIEDVRSWHTKGLDWRGGFAELDERYGYAKYGGGCHMVPNHALVIHALLHSEGCFDTAIKVVNTCGMDTDCNSANVGCIMGVRGGLEAIGRKWREPVADRLFIPTAEGGRCVTDAVQVADWVVRVARGGSGEPKTKFHFGFPGSVQGFVSSELAIANEGGALQLRGTGAAATATFPAFAERKMGGYGIIASPTIYPDQTIRARLAEGSATLFLTVEEADGAVQTVDGPDLEPGVVTSWLVPDVGANPIVEVGLRVRGEAKLESLTWEGEPRVRFTRGVGSAWREAWVQGCDGFESWGDPFKVTQNRGTGLLIQGTRDWRDIAVESEIRFSLCESGGVALRVQGLRRYYALELVRGGGVHIVRALGGRTVLAEALFAWNLEETHLLRLSAQGTRLVGEVNGEVVLEVEDEALTCGAAAFVVTEGRINAQAMSVSPARV